MPKWITQVFGDVNGSHWEVSVVREDNEHGQKSWGWFDDRKLLVSHNGGPCDWPMAPGVGPIMVEIANRLRDYLNDGGTLDDLRVRQLAVLST